MNNANRFEELDKLWERGKAEGKILDYFGVRAGHHIMYYVQTTGIIYPEFSREFRELAISQKQSVLYYSVTPDKLKQLRAEVSALS